MSNNKNIDNNYNQEIRIRLLLNKKDSSYIFTIGNSYTTENNIKFEYYERYSKNVYGKDIYHINKNEATQLVSDIKNSIIQNFKDLNATVKQVEAEYKKGSYFLYNIVLLIQDSENIFQKLKPYIENVFNSIALVLKNKNVELDGKPLSESINYKKIIISLNDGNLKVDIQKEKYKDDVITEITYNNKNYDILLRIDIGKTNYINVISMNVNFYHIFSNYNNNLEFIEDIKNPNLISDKIINPIVINKNEIEKAINEYKFYEALIPIDELDKKTYNEQITNEIINNFNWSGRFVYDLRLSIYERFGC